MREANNRAAMHIFEQVNTTLLPENILDLHGLHVDEALYHLQQVLEEKTAGKGSGFLGFSDRSNQEKRRAVRTEEGLPGGLICALQALQCSCRECGWNNVCAFCVSIFG